MVAFRQQPLPALACWALARVAPSIHGPKRGSMNLSGPQNLMVGLDVGSTTVKSVVVDLNTQKIIWSDYQRHDTKQPEKCLEFLKRMEADTGIQAGQTRVFITGSGGGGIAGHIGARFVQEVNAVSLAVEHLYPDCGSVVELGGQDAKIIIFKEDPDTGRKKKIP
jgi:activator of 2-hydroxyglutaryl-CoA dehydratase